MAPQSGELQEITSTPAGPYFVHHPTTARSDVPTIVFLPGGSGAKRNAQRAWDGFFADATGVGAFRVVIPYWPDVEMLEDFHRTLPIIDEVLACFGGDERQVHLGGTSNGGHASFDLMLEAPQRFATLLGAPGEFQLAVRTADLAGLKGKAVFNGVGARDDEFWHKGVRDAHDMLTQAGVESLYVEFPGQGHSPGPGFPKELLVNFWVAHSAPLPR